VGVEIGARSDVGRKRAHNEDSYCVLRELGLFVISDGIGGQAKGEVASAIAVEAVATHCLQLPCGPNSCRDTQPGPPSKARHLANAVHWANRKIRTAATSNPAYRGMGATVVAAWLDGDELNVVNIGDSRAYMLRDGTLKQLTRDHSLAAERERRGFITKQEAATSTLQNVLLQALGTSDKIDVECAHVSLQNGDVVLLCTDGLTHMLGDSEIAGILATCWSAQAATDRLVELANARGGKDNITVVVLRIVGSKDGVWDRLRRRWGNS
jgi:protein phosphatase